MSNQPPFDKDGFERGPGLYRMFADMVWRQGGMVEEGYRNNRNVIGGPAKLAGPVYIDVRRIVGGRRRR